MVHVGFNGSRGLQWFTSVAMVRVVCSGSRRFQSFVSVAMVHVGNNGSRGLQCFAGCNGSLVAMVRMGLGLV